MHSTPAQMKWIDAVTCAAFAESSPLTWQALDTYQKTIKACVGEMASRANESRNRAQSESQAGGLGDPGTTFGILRLQNDLFATEAEASYREYLLRASTKVETVWKTARDASAAGNTQVWPGFVDHVNTISESLKTQQTLCAAFRQSPPFTHPGTIFHSVALMNSMAASSSSSATTGPPLAPWECPPYEMSKSTKPVAELVEEWWVPHGPYNTCIAQLEEEFGRDWRADEPNPTTGKRKTTKSRLFSDRHIIIQEVERRAEEEINGKDREVNLADRRDAAKELDEEREGGSLASLQAKLGGERLAKKRRIASDDQQGSTAS
jgi:Transcriptional activator of glycolytic enzymes